MLVLRRGDFGPSVKFLQGLLDARGYALRVDGDFGGKTEGAVEQFQAAHNLDVDGVVGPATWAKLQAGEPIPTPVDVLKASRNALLTRVLSKHPTSTALVVITYALTFLGKDEHPRGSNCGQDIEPLIAGAEYWDYWGIPASDRRYYPWCVTACMAVVGHAFGVTKHSPREEWHRAHPLGEYYGGTSQIEDWAKRNAAWILPANAPPIPPGALATLSRTGSGSDPATSTGAGHTLMVLFDNHDNEGTVTTWEGNVDQGVRSWIRKKSDLRGIVLWDR